MPFWFQKKRKHLGPERLGQNWYTSRHPYPILYHILAYTNWNLLNKDSRHGSVMLMSLRPPFTSALRGIHLISLPFMKRRFHSNKNFWMLVKQSIYRLEFSLLLDQESTIFHFHVQQMMVIPFMLIFSWMMRQSLGAALLRTPAFSAIFQLL